MRRFGVIASRAQFLIFETVVWVTQRAALKELEDAAGLIDYRRSARTASSSSCVSFDSTDGTGGGSDVSVKIPWIFLFFYFLMLPSKRRDRCRCAGAKDI